MEPLSRRRILVASAASGAMGGATGTATAFAQGSPQGTTPEPVSGDRGASDPGPRYSDVLPTRWLAVIPPERVKDHLHPDDSVIAKLQKQIVVGGGIATKAG